MADGVGRGRAGRRSLAAAGVAVGAVVVALLGVAMGPSLLAPDAEPAGAVPVRDDPTGDVATPEPSPSPLPSPSPTATPGPTPAPTPVPEYAVRIGTSPAGADVTIVPDHGQETTGRTPLTATLPEGPATVRLEHDGRQPLVRPIVVDGDQRHRWLLDPEGQLHHEVGTFETGSAPKQVAFTPDGRELWVTLLGGPGVAVHDPLTGKRVATIDLADHGAVEVIFTADGSTAYVSQMESASVFEVDTATHEVRRQLPTEGVWTKVMALSPDEDRLYASNWVSNDVSEIDLETGEVVRLLPVVTTPRGLFVTPDGGTLYVAGFDDGELQRIDLRTGEDDILVETGGSMRHLVGDVQRGLLYASDMRDDVVFVHDLATDEARVLVETDTNPNTIDVTPDGRVLYVSNRGRNNPETYYIPGPEWGSVLAVDTTTGQPLDAIVGGNQSTGLDVSDDGTLLAFSDFLDNQVQVFEIPPYRVLANGHGGRFGRHRDDLDK